jgi:hypothetical protein
LEEYSTACTTSTPRETSLVRDPFDPLCFAFARLCFVYAGAKSSAFVADRSASRANAAP